MFDHYLNIVGEYGTITELQYPLFTIRGLPHAHPNEMLIFEEGQIGQVYDIDHDTIHALAFTPEPIALSSKVTRTNATMSISVGLDLLGKTVDPLMNTMFVGGKPMPQTKREMRQIYELAPGINSHRTINEQLITGVTKVDLLIPLGHGQRELIMGDVKTGKTMFLLASIVNQVKNYGAVAIYAAIGKKKTEISTLQQFFIKQGIADRVVIVATTADDIASTIYICPYSAMTIAEYFKDLGVNVLIVMDDMTIHAQRYREIALKSRRFPGRESYPGDIFYTHASLLERAGNFFHPTKGTVSISCLPVVLTTEGDITGYIPSNIMSMTDGHVFFDSSIYNKGERPAINIPLSVTRVGRQTQSSLGKEITRTILSTISEYNKISNISYLGSELSDDSKKVLIMGEAIMNLLHQDMMNQLPYEIQLLLFGLVWLNHLDLSGTKSYEPYLPTIRAIINTPLYEELKKIIEVKTMKEFMDGLNAHKQLLSLCETVKN